MVACKNNEDIVYQAVIAGILEIMDDGTIWRVRRLKGGARQGGPSVPCDRIRAERDGGRGGAYLQVSIRTNRGRILALAHRLVFRHFNGPIPIGLTINHKDGHKKNNHPANLELATYSEQQIHALRVLKVGRAQQGTKNPEAKLTPDQVREIRHRYKQGQLMRCIAEDFGIVLGHVSRIVNGSNWSHIS